VQLKQASVSSRVITAMLDRVSPPAAPPPAAALPGNQAQDIRIVVAGKEVRLMGSRGDLSATGMWPVVMTYLNYPGLRARTRTATGVWRMTPKRELKAGEYGVVVPGGVLYEFGVD
jgi:hypothetical protein